MYIYLHIYTYIHIIYIKPSYTHIYIRVYYIHVYIYFYIYTHTHTLHPNWRRLEPQILALPDMSHAQLVGVFKLLLSRCFHRRNGMRIPELAEGNIRRKPLIFERIRIWCLVVSFQVSLELNPLTLVDLQVFPGFFQNIQESKEWDADFQATHT